MRPIRLCALAALLTALAGCGVTPIARTATGAVIGGAAAVAAGASTTVGVALGAGAGYFSR